MTDEKRESSPKPGSKAPDESLPAPEEELLDALARIASEEDREADALWAAVEAGDADALPEDGPGLDVLRPLDEAERGEMADSLFGLSPASSEPGPEAEREAPAAPVIDLAARRRRTWVSAGVGLALAAGLAMIVFGRSAALPEYALEVRAGEQIMRGDEVATKTFAEGSVLSAVLRPQQAVEGEVEVAVVLVPESGAARPVDLRTQVSETGAVRFTGVVGRELPVGPGTHRLVFLVAPKGGLPSDPAAAHEAAPAGGRRLQYVFLVSVRE